MRDNKALFGLTAAFAVGMAAVQVLAAPTDVLQEIWVEVDWGLQAHTMPEGPKGHT